MQRLLLFIGFMALGAVLAYVITVRDEPPADFEYPLDLPRNQMRLSDVVFEQQANGVVAYRIWADTAAYREKSQQTLLTGVRIAIYPRPGSPPDEPVIRGTADQALLTAPQQSVRLDNHVVIQRGGDTMIRGDRMEYQQNANVITVPAEFWLRDKATIHTGRSLHYDLTSQQAFFESPFIEH